MAHCEYETVEREAIDKKRGAWGLPYRNRSLGMSALWARSLVRPRGDNGGKGEGDLTLSILEEYHIMAGMVCRVSADLLDVRTPG